MVLDIAGKEHGANVIQFPEHGGDNQLWTWKGFCIVSKLGYALDVKDNGTKKGTNVIGWEHNGGDNQKWKIQGDKIISCANDMALDIKDGSHEKEALIICWPLASETDVNNQSWRIKYV